LTLRAAGASATRIFAGAITAGLLPLALGTGVLSEYDLWPTALTAAAIAALVTGHHTIGLATLAGAMTAKLYALALLPLALVYVARRRSLREAAAGALAFGIVSALVLLPFSFGSATLRSTAEGQTLGRSLHLESLPASVLWVLDRLGVYDASVAFSSNTFELRGSLPDALANVMTAAQILVALAVWIVFWRGRTSDDRFLTATAAVVAGYVAFGRVFSPQYLIWLFPLVPLVAGRLMAVSSALLASAAILTQLWFPARWFELPRLGGLGWLVLARDLAVVALYGLLLIGLARMRPSTRAP
jgi:hypothetical protein